MEPQEVVALATMVIVNVQTLEETAIHKEVMEVKDVTLVILKIRKLAAGAVDIVKPGKTDPLLMMLETVEMAIVRR
jgi:hypothetical protein